MLGQRKPASNLYYTIMDVEKHSGKTSSPVSSRSKSSRAEKQSSSSSMYSNIVYSTVVLVITILAIRSQLPSEFNASSLSPAPISRIVTSLRELSHDVFRFFPRQEIQSSNLPHLPNNRDDFFSDPVERFDVDGNRPLGFIIVGLVILFMGIIIGL
ncbi:hypothetical protein CLIB1423_26S00848 [[Candida] railenensis]|uniref:Uncharacterized protein n=1 Tax=[Candida] railenensis TaxID=45579 RepID=A0A9P0VZU6_9ASCO|nr:hypothetical protein CLIB1423_26S00848 [[Candida] railenensis]